MVLVAELPIAAVFGRIAPVGCRGASVGVACAIFPWIALVVGDTVALPGRALLGDLVAALPVLAVIIVDAEARLCLAVMSLQVALLPTLAVSIELASSRENVASLADDVALLPGIAVQVAQAVARCRAALVRRGVAKFERRIALGIAVAVSRPCPAGPCAVAYLPWLAVGIGLTLAFLEDAQVGVGQVAGLECVIAVGLGFAITGERQACAVRHVAVLPLLAVRILGAGDRPPAATGQ
jgi:hypothetical protein